MKFLTENDYDKLITGDCDAHDANTGALLLRFRKGVMPLETARLGYKSFEKSIENTEGRGAASGSSGKRIRKDGSESNITVGSFVESGNVGYMDKSAMIHYCRRTAFARKYFDEFKAGIPFVEAVDKLYAELCPEHYARQKAIADGTNKNYIIGNTVFTTVTVNRNFRTAVHKDSGDYEPGFGNLCVYREGGYDGFHFCLPEYRIAVDMQNTDMLFVDVHRWHGNTEPKNMSPDWLRIAFVMYYREYMYQCKQPAEELQRTKMESGGFLKL
jgi:hypothetical protein